MNISMKIFIQRCGRTGHWVSALLKGLAVLGGGLVLYGRLEAAEPGHLYGALQSSLEHAEEGYRSGWRVAVISVAWDAFEPVSGKVDEAYVKRVAEKARAFRGLGYRLQLDLGIQYPPPWIFDLPHARYRNQFGRDYESNESGRRMPNLVFNRAVRDRLAGYVEQLFKHLGTDWDWVRLGGGFYGEVNYPGHRFDGKENCYWAFDEVAQGKVPGLAGDLAACPVPGWIPGGASPDHEQARKFLEWYLGSLQNYHDWQIRNVRRWYSGDICLLYGSWGIRPGGIEAALEKDLNGSSPAEKVGEIQTGYDWARMIGGIRDPKAIVYCTWLDAPRKDCDDTGENPSRWSPVHWQASLAAKNPLRLKVWGENTGRGSREAMQLSFERIRQFGLMGILWAFEKELFNEPNPGNLATFQEMAECIRKEP